MTMKLGLIISILLIFQQVIFQGKSDLNMWPKPQYEESGKNTILIDCGCSVEILINPENQLVEIPPYVYAIIGFYHTIIWSKDKNKEPIIRKGQAQFPKDDDHTVFTIRMLDMNLTYPNKTEDEQYELRIFNRSVWELYVPTYAALTKGLEALSELVYYHTDNWYHIDNAPIKIIDKPAFLYRGIMIDTARHYLSIEMIEKTIDALMFNKMNVLHWHIVDDESFPLDIPSYPNISIFGRYNTYKHFTPDDIDDIIYYAQKRGVIVIPEIDTPSHTCCWGFPKELSDIIVMSKWSYIHGQFDPTMDKTYDIVTKVMEYINEKFPGNFVHFGGDEVDTDAWESRQSIKDWMVAHKIKDMNELQTYYRKRQKDIWKSKIGSKKRAMYWTNHDIHLPLEPDDILHWWGPSEMISVIKDFPNDIILSTYDLLYLDLGFGGYGEGYGQYLNWMHIYKNFDPIIPDIKGKVIGAITCLWSEINNDNTQMDKLWIRASVLGEKVWNPNAKKTEKLSDFVRRLVALSKRLNHRGIDTCPVSSEICESKPDMCFSD